MSCVNSDNKCQAPDCRQPRADKAQQPFFICRKTGHVARDCPDKDKQSPVKMVADNGVRPIPHFLGCVQKTVDS